MSAIDNLKAVLCDPEGNVSIHGSGEDIKIIQDSLAEIEKQLDLFTYDALRRRTMTQTIKEEAEELVESEFCGDCRLGCHDQEICDGYKEEVERVIKDMKEE